MFLTPAGRLCRPKMLSCIFVIRNIHVPHPCGAALPSKNAFLHFCDSEHPCSSPLRGGFAVQKCFPAFLSNSPTIASRLGVRILPFHASCCSLFRSSFSFGAPGEIRTPDHSVRSRVLYPAELRARAFYIDNKVLHSRQQKKGQSYIWLDTLGKKAGCA